MRIFFAVWPPAEAARALARWALETQRQTGGNATHESKIHLTLAFLGDADHARAIRAARKVRAPGHTLPIEQARYWRDSRIVWAGPRETPSPLLDLFNRLKAELYEENFMLEPRPFAAHVTLIRKARAAALPPLPAMDWPVGEFVLVRSALSPAGSSYEVLERFPL
jgi:RNA 2',3'-cyclic 3'-phosphodiesterase